MTNFLFIFFLQITTETSFHHLIKEKFVEGNVLFMSLVALSLIVGLAFCIERITYITLSEINARKFVDKLSELILADKVDEAKEKARATIGPVASICYQGLLRIDESIEDIDRSMESYANVQLSLLEKGSAWIKLFIAIAPSLGFLGTVIGMVMAFENIEVAGDISPSIVAEGMKVALVTTIFGIIAAIILQLFYNFILTKIDRITMEMEESAISLIDVIGKYKQTHGAD